MNAHRRLATAAAAVTVAGIIALPTAAAAFPGAAPQASTPKCPNSTGHYPPGQCKKLSASSTTVPPGGSITVSGQGFGANEPVNVDLHSTPVLLATPQTDANGTFTTTVTIPSNTPMGTHTITATGQQSGVVTSLQITVASSSSSLPFTGAGAVIPLSASGAAMVIAGGLTLIGVRRRRRSIVSTN